VSEATGRARRPLLDAGARHRLAQTLLGLAGALAVAALARPLSPDRPVWLRATILLLLAAGLALAALLTSLRGRAAVDAFALYALLVLAADAARQLAAPSGWPTWPLMALLIASVSIAEPAPVALAIAALAATLDVAQAAASGWLSWKPALVSAAGYGGTVLFVHRALAAEKARLTTALGELARLRHGIDHLDDGQGLGSSLDHRMATMLRQVSEEERRSRQMERAAELDASLERIVTLARRALGAHSVQLFSIDRHRETACLRAAEGPDSLRRDAIVSVQSDPFAFVLDRGQAFYATDFKRLLWALPYYKGDVKIGSLLASPVRDAGVVIGVLVADRLEIQSLTADEPEMLDSFAALAAEAFSRTRALAGHEEAGTEFEAVYGVSQEIASMEKSGPVCRALLSLAQQLVPLEGGAVVLVDEANTRYVAEAVFGWAEEFKRRAVAIDEKTWAAWSLRGAQVVRLDQVGSEQEPMPVLVLDEESRAGESLLVLPLKVRDRALGAVVLTAQFGVLRPSATRVLEILVNQAAALLATIQLAERMYDKALHDPLTGLLNRRAFADSLAHEIARRERQGGTIALLMLDLDHFKKLNDTHGHPAGDAALKRSAELFGRHLRRGDLAARYGGEEFVVMLPGADEEVALTIAERIRSALEHAQIEFGGAKIRVTASVGLAVWPEHGRGPQELLGAADRALYTAKGSGRNRVVAAPPVEPEPVVPPA
jgi:diguanylate cyclase (GGDEF)-like protein